MNLPDFTFEKIKFATDQPTFEKAVKLYQDEKVVNFEEGIRSYSAQVLGTEIYKVFVEARDFRYSDCNCYIGQKGELCKHIIAVALYSVLQGKEISNEMIQLHREPKCSGKIGELTGTELKVIKQEVKTAISYIRSYNGRSRLWFSYQNKLDEGCIRLSEVFSKLPVSEQTSDLIVNILIRLDKKLSTGGVDDSDGTVGDFITASVNMLLKYANLVPECRTSFEKIRGKSTCFGWEEPILQLT